MNPLLSSAFLVADTETTGNDPRIHKPVEVGFVLIRATGGPLLAWSSLVNPDQAISSEAKAVHHIQEKHLVGAPLLGEALMQFGASVASAPTLDAYVAHKADFDSKMLPQLTKKPWLCTLRLAKKLYPDLPHHGNQYLRYELKLNVPEAEDLPAHRALADCYVTAALLQHLVPLAIKVWKVNTVGELIERVEAPTLLERCTFPKHSGKPWEEVVKTDRQYVIWLQQPKPGKEPLDVDVAYTINYWLTR